MKRKPIFLSTVCAILIGIAFISYAFNDSDFLYVSVTIEVAKSDSSSPAGTRVTLTALEWPWTIHHDTIAQGQNSIVFDSVFKACYRVDVECFLYHRESIDSICFENDTILSFVIDEKIWGPTNLMVDPLTSNATWEAPCITALALEDFEDELFPPPGWITHGAYAGMPGWFRTNEPGTPGWPVPTWDSYCAQTVCPPDGSGTAGFLDYLITPPVDLREADYYSLKFDSYYDAHNGHLAYVEYSYDAGETWSVFHAMNWIDSWQEIELDLSQFSGPENPESIWFAFHGDGGTSLYTSGWVIDNVEISECPQTDWPYYHYNVYLDEGFVDSTTNEYCVFECLEYGDMHTVSVEAVYASQASDQIHHSWTSTFLFPPRNLQGTGGGISNISWELPMDCNGNVPDNLLGFNVFRDFEYMDYVPYEGQQYPTWNEFELQPGTYLYTVTAVYDLTPYGFPGQTGESDPAGPVEVIISYGHSLPFIEQWETGSFVDNEWMIACDNWEINIDEGNPEPTAMFAGFPAINEPYSCGLISFPINAMGFIDGDIHLSFDIKLNSPNGSYNSEKMIISLWENGVWYELHEIENNGSFYWTSYDFDITSVIYDTDFKIGFFAEGDNSTLIEAWFIDNISISLDCYPALLFDVEEGNQGTGEVLLTWMDPSLTYGVWEFVHDGEFDTEYAPHEGGSGMAQRITPTSYPAIVTKVRFYVTPFINHGNPVEVYILDETASVILSSPLIAEGFEGGDWAEVNIKDVVINEGDFYIATINPGPDGPYIGVDWDTYYNEGLLIGNIGDFVDVADLGCFCTSSHEAYVEYEYEPDSWQNNKRGAIGYNIFRAEEGINDYIRINEQIHNDTSFLDIVPVSGSWCYYVTSVYDECESMPSDTVCSEHVITSIHESFYEGLNIYPNPAREKITIEYDEEIIRIEITELSGQILKKAEVRSKKAEVNMEEIQSGTYFLNIYSGQHTFVKKIIIIK